MYTVKQKLYKGEVSFGTWQMMANTSVSEILCQAGYDWVTVDMEHTGIDVSDALELIRVIDLCGKTPAVRVSCNDATVIKRVMDCGAKIIIVPMVMNREDAQKAVNAAYYPPAGQRGVGLSRAQDYGFGFERYKVVLEESVVIVAQIEHIIAIERLDEIVSVEGIDATMIGPYDLSGSLGKPGVFDTPEFKAAIDKYESINRMHKKAMGYHIVKPDKRDIEEHIRRGYQFVALGFDTFFLGEKSRDTLKMLRG